MTQYQTKYLFPLLRNTSKFGKVVCEMGTAIFLGIIILLFVLFKRWSRVYEHWAVRGIPHKKPYLFVGNMLQNVLRKKRLGEVLSEICLEYKDEPIVGVYNYTMPVMVLNNLDYVYTVCIKEFSHFTDRNAVITEKRPIDRHLFALTGVEWRAVRMKMTPIFTTGKLKGMLSLMENCFDRIRDKIESTSNTIFKLKDLTDKYTINVRGYCVFGLDKDIDAKLAKDINDLNSFNIMQFLRLTLNIFFLKLAIKLNLTLIGKDLEDRVSHLVINTINTRSQSGIQKNDFVQTLLQLKQTGHVEVGQWLAEDDYLKMGQLSGSNIKTVAITDDHIFAQSMIFLLAGLDVLKTSIMLALVETAKHKEVYKRLQEEVDSTFGKYNDFSYQSLKDMKYLEMCIKETLRMHPPAELGVRHCVKDFTFPNGTTVEKGTPIFFPLKKFLWDPTYFPEPEKFDPDRFAEGDPPAYLSFGLGPRQCIAMRFAMLEMKMFLSKFIYNYDFQLDPKTEEPIQFEKWFFLLKINSDIFLRLKNRSHNVQ